MKKYRHRQRGSITVFVTIILIPTLFLTGLLTDLSRIKLYSNQALMAADNYGEAVLTQYDNLLKELYGLFAISQYQEGKDAIEELQAYMKTSFNPAESSVQFQHLQEWLPEKDYDNCFMPYSSAEIELSHEAVDGANLATEEVLSTQIGDFMRYRSVEMLMDESGLLAALDEMNSCKANAKVIEKKQSLDDEAEKFMDEVQAFYSALHEMCDYELYLHQVNNQYTEHALKDIYKLTQGSDEERYMRYIEELRVKAEPQEPEDNDPDDPDAEEESEYEETYDFIGEQHYFETQFRTILSDYKDVWKNTSGRYLVTCSNYEAKWYALSAALADMERAIEKIADAQSELEASLNNEDVNEDLKNNLETELRERYAQLTDPEFLGNCKGIVNEFKKNMETVQKDSRDKESYDGLYTLTPNEIFMYAAGKIYDSLEEQKDYYLEYDWTVHDSFVPYERSDQADQLKCDYYYANFKKVSAYRSTYENLDDTFGSSEGASKKKGKSLINKLKKLVSEQDESVEDETTTARSIPENVPVGTKKGSENVLVKFRDKISSVSGMFDEGLIGAGNTLFLKFYTVMYDFGMFSCRVTDVEKSSTEAEGDHTKTENTQEELKKSLTKQIMADTDYLYQAELEYLFGGYKDSKDNLNKTRNTILTFRAAMNMTSTFTIQEINSAVMSISEPFMAVPPVGIALNAALRAAIAALETYEDWKLLKKGQGVILLKMKVEEFSTWQRFVDWLQEEGESIPAAGEGEGSSEKKDVGGTVSTEKPKPGDGSQAGDSAGNALTSIELDYEQYMALLLILFTGYDDISKRTGDLICLNVNYVRQGKPDSLGDIEFKLDEAVTAVKASCSVHLDYMILQDGFGENFAEKDTYSSIKEFEKNKYKYSIIRGY